MSQSLWNRAESFDKTIEDEVANSPRLNPFGTGRGLSTALAQKTPVLHQGFNPFGAGRGLSTFAERGAKCRSASFNPFGTGRSLST